MLNDNMSFMADRFRGFLPVIVDVETGGFNPKTDALLEIAAVTLNMDKKGFLEPGDQYFYNVHPFHGANIEKASLDFTGIDPKDPLRKAVAEEKALQEIFQPVRKAIKKNHCNRAIMVAHNASFDLGFVNAASERCNIKRNPFHPFSTFDTVTLAGLAYGQTVLARACEAAGIEFDNSKAHHALYDAKKTAELFCIIVNRWKIHGGWNPAT